MPTLTCPEGLVALQKAHPDVPIYTAAIDRQLHEHGYILPSVGDAGDRIYGTRYASSPVKTGAYSYLFGSNLLHSQRRLRE